MTAIDGQPDIFDELNPVRVIECPHCSVSWTPAIHLGDDAALEVHTRRTGGTFDEWPGKCVNQRMALPWLYARAVPSGVKYRG